MKPQTKLLLELKAVGESGRENRQRQKLTCSTAISWWMGSSNSWRVREGDNQKAVLEREK